MVGLLGSVVLALAPGIPPAVHPCAPASPYYCGTLSRPLDPSGGVSGSIAVHFEWLPRSDRSAPSEGTIVANEGGPGSGSTESRDAYETLFRPLLGHRDLLLMDNRGTGKSGVIVCEPLQNRPVFLDADIAACGAQLGNRSLYYRTALAADDLAAVMDAMGVRRADMYGDSYGTFFTQTFAVRHPDRLRSIVLDGAYPIVGLSPWYPEAPAAVRRAFDAVCLRAPACAALPGTSMRRIAHLLDALRVRPARGAAPVGGAVQRVTVTPGDLAFVMVSAGLSPVAYRELDAAARAFLSGDALPLLRLAGEAYAVDEATGSADLYSRGLFTAVSCADDPQAFDMRASVRDRRAQWRAALTAESSHAPSLYAPFTFDEWMKMPLDFSYTPLCVDWPAQASWSPNGGLGPHALKFPPVPTLVISGELDTITPAAQGDAAAAHFSHSWHVIVRNSVHVDALGDEDDCASVIVRRFVQDLTPGDTSCAGRVRPIVLVLVFAKSAAALAPAAPEHSDEASAALRRVAAAALQTIGDVVTRASFAAGVRGLGLRGGSYSIENSATGQSLWLHRVRFVDDVAVDGSVTSDSVSGEIRADARISGAATGRLTIGWNQRVSRGLATIDGELDGNRVHATAPVP